jgi:glycosyltransferase involved in cell wall biosynthesis
MKVFNFLDKMLLRIELNNFFDPYDLICFIQIETYYILQNFLNNNSKIIIHLMSHQVQYKEPLYTECLPNRNYRFVLADQNQQRDLSGSMTESAESQHIPLVLDMKDRNLVYKVPSGSPFKIAVFTRLSTEKPIEFFLYALHDLLQTNDVTLHIYGRGNPNVYSHTLNMLQIQNRVFFLGHKDNLERTITQDRIGIGWMLSADSYIGYASIELASFGLPLIFWNLFESSYNVILSQTNGAIHSFQNNSDFISFNKVTLKYSDRLITLGKRLRDYVTSENNIDKHISCLEDFYQKSISHCKTGEKNFI